MIGSCPQPVIWNIDSGKVVRELPGYAGQIVQSPDGKALGMAAGSVVTVRDLEGTVLRELRHPSSVWPVAWSSDGRWLATGCLDNIVRLWNPTTGDLVRRFRGHHNGILSLAFNPKSDLLVSGSGDGLVKFWDVNQSEDGLRPVSVPRCWTFAFSPNGRHLAAAAVGFVAVQDRSTGTIAWKMPNPSDWNSLGVVTDLAFSPDSTRLVAANNKGLLRFWNLKGWSEGKKGDPPIEQEAHTGSIPQIAFSPDGKMLASVGEDFIVRLWDPTTGQRIRVLRGLKLPGSSLAFHPDGKRLFAASAEWRRAWGEILCWDVHTGKTLPAPRLKEGTGSVGSLACSSDGRFLAVNLRQHQRFRTCVWDLQTPFTEVTWNPKLTLEGETGGVSNLLFSPDSRRLIVTGNGEGTVRIYDPIQGEQALVLRPPGGIRKVLFAPDGRDLYVLYPDYNLHKYEGGDPNARTSSGR